MTKLKAGAQRQNRRRELEEDEEEAKKAIEEEEEEEEEEERDEEILKEIIFKDPHLPKTLPIAGGGIIILPAALRSK